MRVKDIILEQRMFINKDMCTFGCHSKQDGTFIKYLIHLYGIYKCVRYIWTLSKYDDMHTCCKLDYKKKYSKPVTTRSVSYTHLL